MPTREGRVQPEAARARCRATTCQQQITRWGRRVLPVYSCCRFNVVEQAQSGIIERLLQRVSARERERERKQQRQEHKNNNTSTTTTKNNNMSSSNYNTNIKSAPAPRSAAAESASLNAAKERHSRCRRFSYLFCRRHRRRQHHHRRGSHRRRLRRRHRRLRPRRRHRRRRRRLWHQRHNLTMLSSLPVTRSGAVG